MRRQRGGIETARSHWSQLMEGMQASPTDFYQAIADAIERRQVPGRSLSRVQWREGGWFSAKRLYLRVERGDDLIDICGAPFGNAFFASSWLCLPPPSLLKAVVALATGVVVWFLLLRSLHFSDPSQPFAFFYRVPPWYQAMIALLMLDTLFIPAVLLFGIIRPLFFPPKPTYYRYDTAQMFYTAVHAAVIEVIQGLRTTQGLRPLTEEETKPIMPGFGR